MTMSFLPEFKIVPTKEGGYRASYRLFEGKPFRLIPGEAKSTAGQALNAAKAYVREKLNPPIRTERPKMEPAPEDALGLAKWRERQLALLAEAQEKALGGVITRGGKLVAVERKGAKA